MSSKDCEELAAKCKQFRAENIIHLETFKNYYAGNKFMRLFG